MLADRSSSQWSFGVSNAHRGATKSPNNWNLNNQKSKLMDLNSVELSRFAEELHLSGRWAKVVCYDTTTQAIQRVSHAEGILGSDKGVLPCRGWRAGEALLTAAGSYQRTGDSRLSVVVTSQGSFFQHDQRRGERVSALLRRGAKAAGRSPGRSPATDR